VRQRRWVGATNRNDRVSRGRLPAPPPRDPIPAEIGRLRRLVGRLMDSSRVQKTITAIIILNAVTLGLETSESVTRHVGHVLGVIDIAILSIFVIELSLKFFAQGLRFFRSGWNLFDALVVGIALVPSAGALSVLRALRILRVLRLVTVVPAMRKVVTALFSAIPGVLSIIALLGLVFYVFGVICARLYGESFPQWFGTIGESMYSLFQIMTLESWSMGIVRPVMETYPQAWLVFVPFILLTSFAVLNLFIAVIVNAMQDQHAADVAETQEEIRDAAQHETALLMAEIKALRDDVRGLRERMRDLSRKD